MLRQHIVKKKYFYYLSYLLILIVITFYNNKKLFCFKDAQTCGTLSGNTGDFLKFVRLAIATVAQGSFHPPRTHTPGLEVINIILFSLTPNFPTVPFLGLLNCLLYAFLFYKIFLLSKISFGNIIAFLLPLFLLVPFFSYSYFLRGEGVFLGTAHSTICCCLGVIYLITPFPLEKRSLFVSILMSGLFFSLSAYLWSFFDSTLTSISLIVLTFTFIALIFKRKWILYSGFFQWSASFIVFWGLTAPYKIYNKSFSMVKALKDEMWQRIWMLPTHWTDVKYKGNWIFRGGGFPFCRAYPDICKELYEDPSLHENIAALKHLAIKTFLTDPVTLLRWKLPYLARFWVESNYPREIFFENIFILGLLPLAIIISIKRLNKYVLFVQLFNNVFFCLSISLLILAHIETRYFYPAKFIIIFSFLLTVILCKRQLK